MHQFRNGIERGSKCMGGDASESAEFLGGVSLVIITLKFSNERIGTRGTIAEEATDKCRVADNIHIQFGSDPDIIFEHPKKRGVMHMQLLGQLLNSHLPTSLLDTFKS